MNKKLKKILLIFFCAVFVLSTGTAAYLLYERQREAEVNASVMALVRQSADIPDTTVPPDTSTDTGVPPEPTTDDIPDSSIQDSGDKVILEQYAALYQANPDTIGWLRINKTKIDYVVMQTPDDPEKYLRKDFFGKYSSYGTLFLDADCDVDNSDNLIIYGHHIKNDAMFGALLDYKSEDFWVTHRYVEFDTLYEKRRYEIVAAFYAEVLKKNEGGFRYYNFIDAENADAFNEYAAFIDANQAYDTGVDITYGDKLLTLSTCAYNTENGRFAVVAKLIDDAA